jgi:hypothetical protein
MESWRHLTERAQELWVTPLVYRQLKENAIWVPDEVLAEMRDEYQLTARRNMLLLKGLKQVLRKMKAGGIEAIALKGVELNERIYPDIGLRMMADADLLVHHADVERVDAILRGCGYSARPYWISAEIELAHSLPPYTREDGTSMDIHWTFENPDSPFRVDDDGLWQRARASKVAGVEMKTLTAEDFLLHLCLHVSYHHRFEAGLRSLCDIRETVMRLGDRLDWQAFTLRAREWGAERCAWMALHLAEVLVGAVIPAEVMAGMQPEGYADEVEAWALALIFPEEGVEEASVNVAKVLSRGSLREQAEMASSFIFPSRELMSTKFPASPDSAGIWLYYPKRWADLVRRHGPNVWKLVSGNRAMQKANLTQVQGWELANWLGKHG